MQTYAKTKALDFRLTTLQNKQDKTLNSEGQNN